MKLKKFLFTAIATLLLQHDDSSNSSSKGWLFELKVNYIASFLKRLKKDRVQELDDAKTGINWNSLNLQIIHQTLAVRW